MLNQLFTKTKKRTTAESLLQRKDSILSTFKSVLVELMNLKEEQIAVSEQLRSEIKIMNQELKAIEHMTDSTDKTITKISNLIE